MQTQRNNTVNFSPKLQLATSQRFHTSTDAHEHYHTTVPSTLHRHFHYTQLLKSYSYLQEAEPRRYSPPSTKTEQKQYAEIQTRLGFVRWSLSDTTPKHVCRKTAQEHTHINHEAMLKPYHR